MESFWLEAVFVVIGGECCQGGVEGGEGDGGVEAGGQGEGVKGAEVVVQEGADQMHDVCQQRQVSGCTMGFGVDAVPRGISEAGIVNRGRIN